jgi:hypothetical protein
VKFLTIVVRFMDKSFRMNVLPIAVKRCELNEDGTLASSNAQKQTVMDAVKEFDLHPELLQLAQSDGAPAAKDASRTISEPRYRLFVNAYLALFPNVMVHCAAHNSALVGKHAACARSESKSRHGIPPGASQVCKDASDFAVEINKRYNKGNERVAIENRATSMALTMLAYSEVSQTRWLSNVDLWHRFLRNMTVQKAHEGARFTAAHQQWANLLSEMEALMQLVVWLNKLFQSKAPVIPFYLPSLFCVLAQLGANVPQVGMFCDPDKIKMLDPLPDYATVDKLPPDGQGNRITTKLATFSAEGKAFAAVIVEHLKYRFFQKQSTKSAYLIAAMMLDPLAAKFLVSVCGDVPTAPFTSDRLMQIVADILSANIVDDAPVTAPEAATLAAAMGRWGDIYAPALCAEQPKVRTDVVLAATSSALPPSVARGSTDTVDSGVIGAHGRCARGGQTNGVSRTQSVAGKSEGLRGYCYSPHRSSEPARVGEGVEGDGRRRRRRRRSRQIKKSCIIRTYCAVLG